MPAAAALHVGRVEEQVRRRGREFAGAQVADLGVELLADAAHLGRRHPADAELRGHALDLASRDAGRVHLGHGRRNGLVDAAVALEDAVGEIGPAAQLRYAQRDLAGRCDEPALAIAVAAGAPPSQAMSACSSMIAFSVDFSIPAGS